MQIREALNSDLDKILFVERLAFGGDEEAELVKNLLNDPTAKPLLSLLAFKEEQPVGHILFTKTYLKNSQKTTASVILAPLAVIPDAQNQGIGSSLIKKGLEILSQLEVDLVFVLGHPGYYSRHGFKPAGCQGFEASYPIPEQHAEAWMVQALRPEAIGSVSGKVICADALNKPEYWLE